MRYQTNIDTYDGHYLLTEQDGDDVTHEVIHPPRCNTFQPYPVEMPNYVIHGCLPAYHASECGDWSDATTPGLRMVGWHHEVVQCRDGVEHDTYCFTIEAPPEWLPVLDEAT